jgi:thiol-disulfide isomerase/thioredoxin
MAPVSRRWLWPCLWLGPWLVVASGCSLLRPGPTPAEAPLELRLLRYPSQAPWRLSEERGSVVFLDVWATWCEPCREALPLYADLAREYGPRGLKVYAVSVDADPAAIAPFLAEAKVELPVLLDPEGRVAGEQLQVRMMPTSLLIDRRGVLRAVHEGFDDAKLPATLAEVESLLGGG